MPHPSHSSRFYHPNKFWWGVQIIKFLICSFLHSPCCGNKNTNVIQLGRLKQFTMLAISSLTNLDHHSPHVSSVYIIPRTATYVLYSSVFISLFSLEF
jgi:hypothetical protein